MKMLLSLVLITLISTQSFAIDPASLADSYSVEELENYVKSSEKDIAKAERASDWKLVKRERSHLDSLKRAIALKRVPKVTPITYQIPLSTLAENVATTQTEDQIIDEIDRLKMEHRIESQRYITGTKTADSIEVYQKALRIKQGYSRGFATLKHTGRVGLIAGGIAAALTLSGEANANETANRSASNITSDTNVIKIQKTRTVRNGSR